jgi:ketosteroid isomerase-like protein
MHPFRAAVEAGDLDRVTALLAEDVTFCSPAVFKPYSGRETVAFILATVFRVFEDFRYEREIGAPDADDHALVFRARVGDKEVHGVDLLRMNADGQIADLTVMIRPLSALTAVSQAMGAQLAKEATA